MPTTPISPGQPLPPEDLFEQVKKSVFVVVAARNLGELRRQRVSQGSAVAVTSHRLYTNCHVVAGRTLPHPATTPALLPAVGARRYLNALERAGFDPLALAVVHRAGGQGAGGGVGLQLATKWALVTGRV